MVTNRCIELLGKLAGCDAALICTQPNLRYFCGFTGSAGALLLHGGERIFVTDFRYDEQARLELQGFEIQISSADIPTAVIMLLETKGIKSIAIEDESITYSKAKRLGIGELIPAGTAIAQMRQIKSESELASIRAAAKIADRGFEHILEFVRPGMSERQIALELEFYMRSNGADDVSFPPIVASGIRGSMCHASPSHKQISSGELVVMDFGAVAEGYCSDITRTIAIGDIADKHKKVYNICLEAQRAALAQLRAGAIASEIDAAARDIIAANGYGDHFGHGLGHGVGLAVHEPPRLSQTGWAVLQKGMVVTVEPGIYLPGECGVRIEDTCIITNDGCEVLFGSSKELIRL